MIKPDAVQKKAIGRILERYEREGFKILSIRLMRLTATQAEGFYAVHRERPFFKSLVSFMSSGPVVTLVLEGENAVKRHRELMGATDPRAAAPGTLRKEFGTDIERNAVHGSDSSETARFEIQYFFGEWELIG
jgi:nucleoside-diphosphate kinase